jgi:hypothetical protein
MYQRNNEKAIMAKAAINNSVSENNDDGSVAACNGMKIAYEAAAKNWKMKK